MAVNAAIRFVRYAVHVYFDQSDDSYYRAIVERKLHGTVENRKRGRYEGVRGRGKSRLNAIDVEKDKWCVVSQYNHGTM